MAYIAEELDATLFLSLVLLPLHAAPFNVVNKCLSFEKLLLLVGKQLTVIVGVVLLRFAFGFCRVKFSLVLDEDLGGHIIGLNAILLENV